MAKIDLQISSGTPERSMNIDAGYLELRPLLLASKTFKVVLKPQSSMQNLTRPHEINDFNVIFCKFTTLSLISGSRAGARSAQVKGVERIATSPGLQPGPPLVRVDPTRI